MRNDKSDPRKIFSEGEEHMKSGKADPRLISDEGGRTDNRIAENGYMGAKINTIKM